MSIGRIDFIRRVKDAYSHAGFRKYFNNSSWLLSERMLRMATNLFVGIYVINYLGPQKFGELSYAQSFVGLFTAIAMLGLDGIVVRELVKSPDRQNMVLGTAFWMKIAGALLAISVITLATQFSGSTDEEHLLIFLICAALLFQPADVIDFFFQARVQSRRVVYAQLVQLLTSSVLKLVLIWIGASLVWFAAVIVLDGAVLALGLFTSYLLTGRSALPWRFDFQIARNLLQNSWPLILSGIAITIYMRIDQVMIREMLDAESVGQYSAAVRLVEAWYFIPIAISTSLFPAIINARQSSQQLYFQRLERLYLFMVIAALAIALPTTFLSTQIVVTFFGNAYSSAGDVLALYVWAGLFVFIGVVNSKALVAENCQKQSLVRTMIGAVVNVLLNLVLIPLDGIRGAAIATLVSYALSAYLTIPMFRGQWAHFVLVTKAIFLVRMFGKKNEKTH